MLTKTRPEYIPVGSGAASLLLTVLVIMFVPCAISVRRFKTSISYVLTSDD